MSSGLLPDLFSPFSVVLDQRSSAAWAGQKPEFPVPRHTQRNCPAPFVSEVAHALQLAAVALLFRCQLWQLSRRERFRIGQDDGRTESAIRRSA